MSYAEFFFPPVALVPVVLNILRTSLGKTSAVRDGFPVCLIGYKGGRSSQADLRRNWIR